VLLVYLKVIDKNKRVPVLFKPEPFTWQFILIIHLPRHRGASHFGLRSLAGPCGYYYAQAASFPALTIKAYLLQTPCFTTIHRQVDAIDISSCRRTKKSYSSTKFSRLPYSSRRDGYIEKCIARINGDIQL
jgi:hypothetical protein